MSKPHLIALEKALHSFKSSIQITQKYLADPDASKALQETLKAGVIQNFEFCYELCWKLLKRQLEHMEANPLRIDALSFPELIREGGEKNLIHNVKKWLTYRRQRNNTSHTYNKNTADSVYDTALAFYDDAYSLLQALQAAV